MRELLAIDVADGRRALVAHSTRADEDLSPSTVHAADLTERRRRAVGSRPWHALRQVHGSEVIVVDGAPNQERPEADALITRGSEQVLAVHSGDCVPVGLVHEAGAVAAAHAGWRGLYAGVLDATARSLRNAAGPGVVTAAVGPHIRSASYEFGLADLDEMALRFGDQVRATTDDGKPALDLTAATLAALEAADVEVEHVSADCTAELADHYWSHRARQESGRIALVAWLERP
ncbi:MAG: polyphenol oxidase family protein [Actinomycetota bacterium]